jgi:lysophospholipase III
MPSDSFWSADELMVSTPNRNYTVNDYEQFFKDLNYTDGWDLRSDVKAIADSLQAPEVEMRMMYGVQVKTPAQFFYEKQSDFPDVQPSVIYSDGDGTVNLRSLLGYRRWINRQKYPITFKEYPGLEHLATIKSDKVVADILQFFYD